MMDEQKMDRLRELFPPPYQVGETERDFIQDTATVRLTLSAQVAVASDIPETGIGAVDEVIVGELQRLVGRLTFGGRKYLLTLAEDEVT